MGGPRLFSQKISKIPRPIPPPPIKNVPSLTNLPTFSSYILVIFCVLICFLFSSDIIKCILTLFLICEIPPSLEDSIFSGEFTRAHCVNFFKANQPLETVCLSNISITRRKYVVIFPQQFRTHRLVSLQQGHFTLARHRSVDA